MCPCNNYPCSCANNTPVYEYNWFNISSYPCNPCSNTPVCKKKIPAICTFYNGINLTEIGLTTNVNIEVIIAAISATLGTLTDTVATNKISQDTKNTNILAALNDINSRLNTIEGATHPPYVI